MRKNLGIWGLFCALLPMTAGATDAPDNGSITVLAQGAHARIAVASIITAIDAAGWNALWEQVGHAPPAGGLPTGKMAVAVTIGQKSTGGYSVSIRDAQELPDHIIVHYQVHSPSLTAMVSQVITTPYTVALVNKSAKPVKGEAIK
jgi:hypothetical protein